MTYPIPPCRPKVSDSSFACSKAGDRVSLVGTGFERCPDIQRPIFLKRLPIFMMSMVVARVGMRKERELPALCSRPSAQERATSSRRSGAGFRAEAVSGRG